MGVCTMGRDARGSAYDGMSFGAAVGALKAGFQVSRQSWSNNGMWLALMTPAQGPEMTVPYIYLGTIYDDRVPWVPSHADILSEDWILVDETGIPGT